MADILDREGSRKHRHEAFRTRSAHMERCPVGRVLSEVQGKEAPDDILSEDDGEGIEGMA